MVLETHMKLCMREPHFPENKLLPPKLGKWTPNGPKTGFFLNLLKNLVVFAEFNL